MNTAASSPRRIGDVPLLGVCKVVSEKFSLPLEDVLSVVCDTVGVADQAGNGSSMLRVASSERNLVGLRDVAQLPPGKNLAAMTLNELSSAIAQQDEQEQGENVIPFLLRMAGGEFYYGQRGVAAVGAAPSSARSASMDENKEGSAGDSEHKSAVMTAFDVLASEAKFKHLHQIAGWVDLTDKEIWDNYVKDVIQDKITEGDTVFEAGCGVLAFLQVVQELVPNISVGGNDGAQKTIDLVRNELVAQEFRDNFYVGMLPESMDTIPADSWDIVCCNSVFQYIVDRNQAQRSVEGMIRVSKKWVIIADICDEKFHKETNSRKSNLSWAQNLPEYRTYPKSWWIDNFSTPTTLVSIRHIDVKTYARRKERYVVYIEKINE